MTQLSSWVERSETPAVAVVTGGSEAAFVAAFLDLEQPYRVLADNRAARDVTRLTNERLYSAPPLLKSGGLAPDLDTLARAPAGPLIFVPYVLLRTQIEAATEAALRRLELVAGYAHPPRLVAGVVVDGVRQQLRTIVARSQARLVVHDLSASLFTADEDGITLIESLPEPTDYQPDPEAPSVPMTLVPAQTKNEAVDAYTLLDHAQFLAETGMAELRKMHKINALPSLLPIYAYWIEQFIAAPVDPKDRALFERAVAAIAKLAEVE